MSTLKKLDWIFSKSSSKISYFPEFPTLAKFKVFPRTVITGNYRWEFPPLVFPCQPGYQNTGTMTATSTAEHTGSPQGFYQGFDKTVFSAVQGIWYPDKTPPGQNTPCSFWHRWTQHPSCFLQGGHNTPCNFWTFLKSPLSCGQKNPRTKSPWC